MLNAKMFHAVDLGALQRAVKNGYVGYQDTIGLAAKAEGALRKHNKRQSGGLCNAHLFDAHRTYGQVVEKLSREELHALVMEEERVMALIKRAIASHPQQAQPEPEPKEQPPPNPRSSGPAPASGYKGIRWRAHRSRWEVNIWNGSRMKFVGSYPTLEEAIQAREEYLQSSEA
jgi:hypothetical protein